jgi:hypothetical protein
MYVDEQYGVLGSTLALSSLSGLEEGTQSEGLCSYSSLERNCFVDS